MLVDLQRMGNFCETTFGGKNKNMMACGSKLKLHILFTGTAYGPLHLPYRKFRQPLRGARGEGRKFSISSFTFLYSTQEGHLHGMCFN